MKGSQNVAGISDPLIDALIEKIPQMFEDPNLGAFSDRDRVFTNAFDDQNGLKRLFFFVDRYFALRGVHGDQAGLQRAIEEYRKEFSPKSL